MKTNLKLFFLTLLILLFWNTPFVYPLKILVTFFHELSHALATWLTGGTVAEFVVSWDESGYVYSYGGWRFLILNAGYLGSLLWGLFFFKISWYERLVNKFSIAIGLLILGITIYFISNTFAIIFGILVALALMAFGAFLPRKFNVYSIRIIALSNMLYVPLDILLTLVIFNAPQSDAAMLANEYGGFSILWGIVWFVTASYLCYKVVKGNGKKQDNLLATKFNSKEFGNN